MGRYTVIPKNAFDALQMDAGVLLFDFDIGSVHRTEIGHSGSQYSSVA